MGLLSCGAVAQDRTPATNTPGAAPPTNAAPAAPKPAEPADKKEYSHALGVIYGQFLTNHMAQNRFGLEPKADLDLGVFFEAFTNVVTGVPMSTNMDELMRILHQDEAYQNERIQAEVEKLKATGPENKVKGEKFMDDIAKAPGVIKLASGVVYKVIKEGDGDKPVSQDTAALSFRFSQVDGTEVWKIEHAAVAVSHPVLPPGMKEALLMMKAGSHWTLYLPYAQAYGEQPGIPDPKHRFKVGPYTALIADVEMESVQHRPGPPPTRLPPGLAPTGAPAPPPPPPGATVTPPAAAAATPAVTSSSIVRVPSAEEAARGEKPRVLTDAEIEALKAEAAKKDTTNAAAK